MIAKFRSARSLAVALAAGTAVAALTVSAPALAQKKGKEDAAAAAAPKVSVSKGFQPTAVALQKAIDAAKARPDVVAAQAQVKTTGDAYNAATTRAAQTAAKPARDAAVAALGNALAAEKTQANAAIAAATTPDDKYVAGQLAVQLGGLASDQSLQSTGLSTMLASGKVAPADVGKFNFFVGSIAYDNKSYAAARTSLAAAIAAGYNQNDVEALLADSYILDNQVPAGLAQLQKAIDARKASGQPAPQNWYRRGLGAAYKAQLMTEASQFANGLVEAYPTPENWGGAIGVLRQVGKYQAQETLDLMRLMDRTNSFAEGSDYAEYLQAADARRLPGEVLRIVDKGLAAGKLQASDVFVAENKTVASGRLAADKASLPGLETSARAGAATAATAMAAADAFLSYGDAAKAEALYTIALSKPGADTPRLLTRQGIAQVDQGKFAEAQATFAKVTGPRQPLARLWAIYAGQKARGA